MSQDIALQVNALRDAFDHELRVANRTLDGLREFRRARCRHSFGEQFAQRMFGVREDFLKPPRRLSIVIRDSDVDTVQHQPCRPACANHSAADNGGPLRQIHAQGLMCRLSRSRVSAGPRTRTFMASRIRTARSTSCPFVASTPRDR